VLDALPWVVDQPEEIQRALGNMAYQLGISGLLKFSKMLEALKNGQRELASIEALDSSWAKQTPARAKRVAKLILG
jgi:lysozyme